MFASAMEGGYNYALLYCRQTRMNDEMTGSAYRYVGPECGRQSSAASEPPIYVSYRGRRDAASISDCQHQTCQLRFRRQQCSRAEDMHSVRSLRRTTDSTG